MKFLWEESSVLIATLMTDAPYFFAFYSLFLIRKFLDEEQDLNATGTVDFGDGNSFF